ncbi:MAG TPA: cellulase family glycosylhydrolase [Methanothrix sp.]|nr:cellulase family glycosylhydrolase [Methanothrix sp.]
MDARVGADAELKLGRNGFQDKQGRLVFFRGINIASNAKFPPFIPFEDPKWLDLLAQWGFNMARLTLMWEAIEPRPGQYDRIYLEKIALLVEQASQRGIYILLDMHQDLYSRWVGGDGAPDWAFPPDVDPHNNSGIQGFEGGMWGMAYSQSDEIKRCFTHFFQSQELKEHYKRAWQEVARWVKGNPYVLGYDIMNEPSSGETLNITGEFENGYLKPFYEEVIQAIRKVHPDAVGFVEPNMYDTYFSNLTPFSTHGLIYAPHLYDALSVSFRFNMPLEDMVLGELLEKLKEKAEELGLPLFVGEFGDTWKKPDRNRPVDNAHCVLEEGFTNCAYWDYSVKDVDAWNEEDFSIIDQNGRPRGLEVNVRPYVRRLSGTPTRQSFSSSDKIYTGEFSGGPSKDPTIIYVPESLHYPKGFDVEVSDGRNEYHKDLSELWYFPENEGDHWIEIRPKGSDEPIPVA